MFLKAPRRCNQFECTLALLVASLCALPVCPVAHAQTNCEPQWSTLGQQTGQYRGTNGTVYVSTMWDRDGTGPDPAQLVVGGFFREIGGIAASCIARWDGTSWSPLGAGMEGEQLPPAVRSLAILPNGDLVASGRFTTAGGVNASNVARWDGTSWSPLGPGTIDPVGLVVHPNGDLIGATTSTLLDGTTLSHVVRWNGSAWSTLGGVFDRSLGVYVRPNGDIFAKGRFTSAGGTPANGIARWNGSDWSAFGSGTLEVYVLATLASGELVAGALFTTANGFTHGVARWTGTSWSLLGSGMDSTVSTLTALPNGDVLAGGDFTVAGGVSVDRVARWDGTTWSAVATGFSSRNIFFEPSVSTLTVLPDGGLFIGGEFFVRSIDASSAARWGIPSGCSQCDSIDFNRDSLFPADLDLVDFFSVLAGGACSTNNCNDIDFNNDGLFPDDTDLIAFLRVLAGGAC